MVVYDVYELSFKTGTFRKYIGYTGDVSKREDKLKRGGPIGLNVSAKCLKCIFFIPKLAASTWRCT